jgi:hypothetical protein
MRFRVRYPNQQEAFLKYFDLFLAPLLAHRSNMPVKKEVGFLLTGIKVRSSEIFPIDVGLD